MAASIRFERLRVGDEIPPSPRVIRREDVKAYADASGDQNPLHQDDEFARSVGFPGIIAHGMYTMAHVVRAVTEWTGDPSALKRMRVQFRGAVYMDETLLAGGRVEAVDPVARRANLSVWAEVGRESRRRVAVKNSEAEVALP